MKYFVQMLCWLPFSDSGSNAMRCQTLREVLPFTVVVLDPKESDCLLSPSLISSASSRKYETLKNK